MKLRVLSYNNSRFRHRCKNIDNGREYWVYLNLSMPNDAKPEALVGKIIEGELYQMDYAVIGMKILEDK